MNNTLLIAIAEIRSQLTGHGNESLKERLKFAMGKAKGHWCVVDEDDQFRSAVGAVMADATQEERDLLGMELDVLKALSAASSGVPVDMGAVLNGFDTDKAIGLSGLWREVTNE